MQAKVDDMKSQVDEIHAAVISSSNPPLSCFFRQIAEHILQIFPPCKQVKVRPTVLLPQETSLADR
jgi:hypothetical protein